MTLLGAAAAAQRPDDMLPRPIQLDTLDALGATVAASVVPVRTTEDLGEGYTPRLVVGEGVAVWMVLPGEPEPTLVTTWFHTARAATIEVYVDGTWLPATTTYGGPMFDLVALVVDTPPPEAPIALAESWPAMTGTFSLAPILPDAESSVVVAAFGRRPTEDYAYYVRSLLPLVNGYPVFDLDGRVVALCSLHYDDRRGGVLAVPLEYIAIWHDEWPQLGVGPIGWQPRVTFEQDVLTTGRDALRTTP